MEGCHQIKTGELVDLSAQVFATNNSENKIL